jgi:hypothetical protein
VNNNPSAWRIPPQISEIFDSIEDCKKRLKGFALAEGFDVVITGTGSKQFPSARFACIHHGVSTQNKRGLEDRVMRNKEGAVISQRQREDTLINQTECKWSVRVSYKGLEKKGSDQKAFILTVVSLDHSGHSLVDNPLLYPGH